MSRWFELAQDVAREKVARRRLIDRMTAHKNLGFTRESAKKQFDASEDELDEVYGKDNH